MQGHAGVGLGLGLGMLGKGYDTNEAQYAAVFGAHVGRVSSVVIDDAYTPRSKLFRSQRLWGVEVTLGGMPHCTLC